MQVELVPLDSLIEDPKNARLHPDTNLAAIEGSLRRFGQVEPLVVQAGTSVVIGGNGRLRVMRKLGWADAHVVQLNITDVQAAALGVTLNRVSELAEWDKQQLAVLISELQDVEFDLDAVGFDTAEIDRIVQNANPPAFDYSDGSTEAGAGDDDPLALSHVRMVQLYLSADTIEEFQTLVQELADWHGTENTTDTVMEVLRAACSKASSD